MSLTVHSFLGTCQVIMHGIRCVPRMLLLLLQQRQQHLLLTKPILTMGGTLHRDQLILSDQHSSLVASPAQGSQGWADCDTLCVTHTYNLTHLTCYGALHAPHQPLTQQLHLLL
jgi:hypothetical protein